MISSRRFGLLSLVLQLAGAGALVACGGSSDSGNGGNGSSSDNANGDDDSGGGSPLAIHFSPMYSAFDGMHDFKLPVVVQTVDSKGTVSNVKGVTFTASDSSKVSVESTDDGATLTMKGAGDVTITATKGSLKSTAKLHITQATPDQWQTGSERYNTMMSALPNGLNFTSGSGGMTINKDGSCTTCHGQTAVIFKVMHTPQQTGGYSDDDLKTIFTMGKKPAGYGQRSGIPACLWGMGHQWNVPDPQALVVYLRSIPPQTQGDFDFPTPNLGDSGIMLPSLTGAGGMLNIPAGICDLIGDGGLMLPNFGDGGFPNFFGDGGFPNFFGDGGFDVSSIFGDGGFDLNNIPGLNGNSGASASDAGVP